MEIANKNERSIEDDSDSKLLNKNIDLTSMKIFENYIDSSCQVEMFHEEPT